ncbi:hypothetical protein Cob_v006092 [Colletotrichum orbiculare MAFF 240422]|uniref:Uncharacterized protein n=1 Tax=Colletotrichum orbiculare (strain 104-T / ATCC 96160 / CBS 514.97 / LARS 414 / MAFF 240422) TaxID=1213857 RepID=A0A484FU22_COLOR|nr:hypothetical protein Cob_v006092 [Colletotrichum orbiculare MAFF 240422]
MLSEERGFGVSLGTKWGNRGEGLDRPHLFPRPTIRDATRRRFDDTDSSGDWHAIEPTGASASWIEADSWKTLLLGLTLPFAARNRITSSRECARSPITYRDIWHMKPRATNRWSLLGRKLSGLSCERNLVDPGRCDFYSNAAEIDPCRAGHTGFQAPDSRHEVACAFKVPGWQVAASDSQADLRDLIQVYGRRRRGQAWAVQYSTSGTRPLIQRDTTLVQAVTT